MRILIIGRKKARVLFQPRKEGLDLSFKLSTLAGSLAITPVRRPSNVPEHLPPKFNRLAHDPAEAAP